MSGDLVSGEIDKPRWMPALVGTDRLRYPSAPFSPHDFGKYVAQRSPRSGHLRLRPRTRTSELGPSPRHASEDLPDDMIIDVDTPIAGNNAEEGFDEEGDAIFSIEEGVEARGSRVTGYSGSTGPRPDRFGARGQARSAVMPPRARGREREEDVLESEVQHNSGRRPHEEQLEALRAGWSARARCAAP